MLDSVWFHYHRHNSSKIVLCAKYSTITVATQLTLQPTHPVRPITLPRTVHLPSYRVCWHELCTVLFYQYVVSPSYWAGVYKTSPFVPPLYTPVRATLYALTKFLHCSLRLESGQYLSSNMAVQNLSAQLSILGLGCFHTRQLP